MRKLLIVGALVALALAPAAGATATRPLASGWITEQAAEGALEHVWDHASCLGVPRFGRRGAFRFTVFDCVLAYNGHWCPSSRFGVKTVGVGRWQMVPPPGTTCGKRLVS